MINNYLRFQTTAQEIPPPHAHNQPITIKKTIRQSIKNYFKKSNQSIKAVLPCRLFSVMTRPGWTERRGGAAADAAPPPGQPVQPSAPPTTITQ